MNLAEGMERCLHFRATREGESLKFRQTEAETHLKAMLRFRQGGNVELEGTVRKTVYCW